MQHEFVAVVCGSSSQMKSRSELFEKRTSRRIWQGNLTTQHSPLKHAPKSLFVLSEGLARSRAYESMKRAASSRTRLERLANVDNYCLGLPCFGHFDGFKTNLGGRGVRCAYFFRGTASASPLLLMCEVTDLSAGRCASVNTSAMNRCGSAVAPNAATNAATKAVLTAAKIMRLGLSNASVRSNGQHNEQHNEQLNEQHNEQHS